MSAPVRIKSALASCLHRAGVTAWMLGRHADDEVAILMYHRILPSNETGPAVQAGMIVEPETLDLHLRYLRERFDIVPLSALVRGDGPRKHHGRPLCALTFDDGWYDFHEHAYPLLSRHEAPATVFLPTDFVGTDRWFWTDRIGLLIEGMAPFKDGTQRASLSGDPLSGALSRLSGTREARLEKAIALLKPQPVGKIEQVLSDLAAGVGKDIVPPGRAFLSWEEVRKMSGSGLVCFGSHTAGHPLLTTLAEEQARDELKRSRDALIAHGAADADFMSFSYPNGNYSEHLSQLVRETGYHLAVTADRGWHRRAENLYTIKRIALHQDMASTEAMLASRIVNLL
jgi:peptidoglycan/xylan/chitin deacetylase (PgdA/CDA1 family)